MVNGTAGLLAWAVMGQSLSGTPISAGQARRYALTQSTQPHSGRVRPQNRNRKGTYRMRRMRWSMCVVLLVGVGLVLSPKWGAATPLPACDPTAYQRLDDTSATGFPPEFCAFSYLPWRVTLPA